MPGTLYYELLALLPAVAMVAGAMMASPARAATFVYVGNAESNDIYVLQLDRQSGELTVVEHVPIPGITKPGNSTPMAVSPDRRFLYVGTRGEPQIAAGFAIDRAALISMPRAAICWRSDNSPTACRAIRSTRTAVSSPSSRNTRWARARTGSRSWIFPESSCT